MNKKLFLIATLLISIFNISSCNNDSINNDLINSIEKDFNNYLRVDYEYSYSEENNISRFLIDYLNKSNKYNLDDFNYKNISLDNISNLINYDKNKSDGYLINIKKSQSFYFIVYNKRIIETSNVLTSNDSFVSSINSSKYISSTSKVVLSSTFAYELSDITLSDNSTVKGYRYITYNMSEESSTSSFYLLEGKSLSSNELYKPIKETISNGTTIVSDYNYKYYYKNTTTEFDPFKKNISSNVLGTKIDSIPYGYSIDNIDLSRVSNDLISIKNIKFNDYPIIVKENNTSLSFYSNFNLIDDLKENNSDALNYIFLGNTTLSSDLTIPKGYALIIDFIDFDSNDSILDNINNYINYYNSIDDFSTIKYDETVYTKVRDRISTSGVKFNNNVLGDLKFTLTIDKGVTLTLNESIISIEAMFCAPSGSEGYKLREYSKVINNGVINLNDSTLRSIGLIEGDGVINSNNNSYIYEIFKPTNFLGGTLSLGFYIEKIFPLDYYYIDNIRCKLILNYGTTYNLISGVYATSCFNIMTMTFMSSNNSGLFNLNGKDSSIIKYIDSDTNKLTIIINSGLVNDNFVNFSIVGSNISSIDFAFPLNNTNLIINNNAILNLSASKDDKSPSYIIMPNSTLNINQGGTLNISNGVKLIDFSLEDEIYNEIISNLDTYNNGSSSYQYAYYSNYKDEFNKLYDEYLANKNNKIKIYGNLNIDNISNFYLDSYNIDIKSNINVMSEEDIYQYRYFSKAYDERVISSFNIKSIK